MTVEEVRVLLVGSEAWRNNVRTHCPTTPMTDFDVMPAMLDKSIGLIVAENKEKAAPEPQPATGNAEVPRTLICEENWDGLTGMSAQTGAKQPLTDESLKLSLDIWRINLDVWRNPQKPNASDVESNVVEQDQKSYDSVLCDAAAELLVSWHRDGAQNTPKEFDGKSFNEHLTKLNKILGDRVNMKALPLPKKNTAALPLSKTLGDRDNAQEPLPEKDTTAPPNADLQVCLYLCEKTVFFALGVATKKFEVTKEVPLRPSAAMHVRIDELHLMALLLVLMAMCNEYDCPLAEYAEEATSIVLDFRYKLRDVGNIEAVHMPKHVNRIFLPDAELIAGDESIRLRLTRA